VYKFFNPHVFHLLIIRSGLSHGLFSILTIGISMTNGIEDLKDSEEGEPLLVK
jgi:hypothetical protein